MLSCEFALRHEALRLVTFEGKNLRDAMFEARRCTELRDVHFITPALVSNVGDGGHAAFRDAPYWYRNGPQGYGKNEDKGKGKQRQGQRKRQWQGRRQEQVPPRRPRPKAKDFIRFQQPARNGVLTARLVSVNMFGAVF